MRGVQPVDGAMVEAARELYLRYGGRQHERIEREMRAAGWNFYRTLLYTTSHQLGLSPGWIERFGWIDMLPEEQRKGLRKRNFGRNYFEHWLRDEFPEWNWSWKYQRYIYRRLDNITKSRSRRLMIFMPPRHGKSEMVTIRYTAWRLLQDPRLNVILGSYNQKLADKFSRRIKRIVQAGSPPYEGGVASASGDGVVLSVAPASVESPTEDHLPAKAVPLLRKEGSFRRLDTAAEWETHGGGVVRSVGVGAGIAGFGAGLIVIDDPVKNRAEAESVTYRDRVWEWFNDDIYTRMEPNAAIILIQTRWHEDDLAGRLLKEMEDGGEQWDVVSLPALAESENTNYELQITNGNKKTNRENEDLNSKFVIRNSKLTDPLGRKPGHALCPKRFSAKTLLKYKRKLGTYSFSALYQQRPAPAEGGQFKREWFRKVVDSAPAGLRWKRGYDLAVSMRQTADYTASFRCAKDRQGNLYIADGFRGRIEFPEQRRHIIERMRAERDTEHGIEAALHGRAFVQDLRRDVGLGRFAFRSVRVDADKLTRALAWLNLAEEGKVYMVRGPWIDDFIDEIVRFPSGRHDDQIDAVSLAVNMLSQRAGKFMTFD